MPSYLLLLPTLTWLWPWGQLWECSTFGWQPAACMTVCVWLALGEPFSRSKERVTKHQLTMITPAGAQHLVRVEELEGWKQGTPGQWEVSWLLTQLKSNCTNPRAFLTARKSDYKCWLPYTTCWSAGGAHKNQLLKQTLWAAITKFTVHTIPWQHSHWCDSKGLAYHGHHQPRSFFLQQRPDGLWKSLP